MPPSFRYVYFTFRRHAEKCRRFRQFRRTVRALSDRDHIRSLVCLYVLTDTKPSKLRHVVTDIFRMPALRQNACGRGLRPDDGRFGGRFLSGTRYNYDQTLFPGLMAETGQLTYGVDGCSWLVRLTLRHGAPCAHGVRRRGCPVTNMIIGLRNSTPVPLGERERHLHIVGQTGTGKTSLLANMLAQDFAADGVVLFDPHGDLAAHAAGLVPRHRRLIYLDPTDTRPVGYNPLTGAQDHDMAATGLVRALRHVWPDSWGPRMEYILINAVRAVLYDPQPSLLGVQRILTDKQYRERIVQRITDPVIRRYWEYEWPSYDRKWITEAISPIQNKIGRILASPVLRDVLCQQRGIDLRRVMDDGQVLIVNLSKGALGGDNSQLLGTVLMEGLAQATFSREELPEDRRRHCFVYVDEFQSFATDSFAVMLSEARKYGVALTLSHQYLSQVPEHVLDAVFGNTGNFLAFRVGPHDAPVIARQLDVSLEHVQYIRNYRAWARLLVDGFPSDARPIDMLPPLPQRDSTAALQESRRRFGVPRQLIERSIAHLLA